MTHQRNTTVRLTTLGVSILAIVQTIIVYLIAKAALIQDQPSYLMIAVGALLTLLVALILVRKQAVYIAAMSITVLTLLAMDFAIYLALGVW